MGKTIAYWIESSNFEGCVMVPDEMTQDMFHEDVCKFIGTKVGVFAMKNQDGIDKRANRAVGKKTWEGDILMKLKTGWTWDEFQTVWSETKKNPSTGKEVNKMCDAAKEEKPSCTKEGSNGRQKKETSLGALDIEKVEKDKVENFLNKIDKDLDLEISQLEIELKKKKEVCQNYVSSTIDNGENEVNQDKKIKNNGRKIKQQEKEMKDMERKEWKKTFEAEVKKVEGVVVEAQKQVSDKKDKIEAMVSKMKNKQNREMRWARQGLRNITLRMIQNSKISFTVLDMYKEESWVNQPCGFQRELDKLENLKRLSISSLEYVTNVLEDQGGAQGETKEQIGVLVLKINNEEFDVDDEELFKVDVDDFMTSLSTTIRKMESVFGRVAIVIPPAREGESKVVESLSESMKKHLPEETLIKDLLKEQEVLEKREKVGVELAEKFVNESQELMSKYSVRRIVSWMANLSEENTGEVHQMCDFCGLIHFSEPCPPEFIEKKDIKLEQENNEQENGEKNKNEDNVKMETDVVVKPKEEDKEIKKLDRNRERSRSPVNRSHKTEERKRKQGRERSRSRSPSTRRNRDKPKDKLPNFTEQCYKCLRDHTWSECTIKHYMRCRTCLGLGHHEKIHEAKKPETKEALKNMYGADFKFF